MPSGTVITFSLNTLSAIVALLTSYYAYRSNRLVGNSVLTAISIGFMLLGIGLAADAGTSLLTGKLLVQVPADRLLTVLASFSYLTVQMVAYLVIAVGYGRAAYGSTAKVAAPTVFAGWAASLYGFSVLSYFVVLVLLAFVVFQGFLLRAGKNHGMSAIVLLAFGLVLVAHLLLLVSALTLGTGLFLLGTGVQFLGFLALLVFVVRSEVVVPK
ncbi:MAG: hypothetical protein JRN06_09645 [Nitrososphaerota archaeon]|nr:hypothetical protein [Nitrososphaerota archaeon]MDG7024848.1 hypothetical protein [Nitrososphaerota archaeon]